MSDNKVITGPENKSGFTINEKLINWAALAAVAVLLIIFTVIVFRNNNKTYKYYAQFSDDIVSTITLKGSNMTLDVSIGDNKISQKGEMKAFAPGDENGNRDESLKDYKFYEVTFEDETVQIMVSDTELVLAYETGEVVKYSKEASK